MSLSFRFDLDTIKMNQRTKYTGHLVQKLLFGHINTHVRPVVLSGPSISREQDFSLKFWSLCQNIFVTVKY